MEKQKKEEKAENESGGEDLNAIASKFTAMQKLGKVGGKKEDKSKAPKEKRPDQRVRERREKQAEAVRKEALQRKEAQKMGKKVL